MPPVPLPPDDADELLAWAIAHDVEGRLDDVIIGTAGPAGTFLPGRSGESLTYRQILLDPARNAAQRRYFDPAETARTFLHRIASLVATRKEHAAFLEAQGRDPEDDALAPFLARLQASRTELLASGEATARPTGTYEVGGVRVVSEPAPMLLYDEIPLTGSRGRELSGDGVVALMLLGWRDEALRWGRVGARSARGEVPSALRLSALDALIDFVRDPREETAHETLAELLRLPAWKYALGTLDENLARIEAADSRQGTPGVDERVAFRLTMIDGGALNIDPVIQKRRAGRPFSIGTKVPWFSLPERRDLTSADRLAYQAYDDRFARRSNAWGGPLAPAQVFGVLRALIDHPAVFLEGDRAGARVEIRQGRLRLRFVTVPDGSLMPQFELLDRTLLAPEVAAALRDDRHLIHLHRPEIADGGKQLLLALLSPQAAAVVQALALAPARFPPDAHDALATRLESLQETVDIEFPSQWTRSIGPADDRPIARLDLLVSGALQVRIAVRPVKLGPLFAPGEGPSLILEGQGRDRHGARRDRQAERKRGHALVERLGLGGSEEQEPWGWRVGEGDRALGVVATLKELGDEVVVEWADEARLLSLGSVGRGDMRMKVADKRDWFAVDGGAKASTGEVARLSDLLAAIREGRRYVRVGARGFVRIEETLREALARADDAVFELRGVIEVPPVASDALMGLIEREAQLAATDAFLGLRRRMKEGAAAEPELPPALEARLRPYQKAGVVWLARLAHWQAGAILADEMGLGKTIQTLAVLAVRAERGPALVIAPTSVVANWVDEAARFVPALKVRLHRGAGRAAGLRDLRPGDLVITSYAIATMDAEALAGIHFATLVIDEAQAVKNATTERAKALRGLDVEWRLALTGTPIENHIGELWSLMRVISPGLLGSWEQFRARYAVPIEKFGDDRRRKALATLLRPFVLRRTKSEVARELPARTELVRVLRLSAEEQALYEELRRSTIEELAAAKKNRDRDASDMRFVLLAALTRMRQLCCHPRLVYPNTHAGSTKAAYLLDLLGELRADGHKALVFSQFRGFLDILAPRLRQQGFRVLVLDGTTPVEVREQRIAAFQAGEAEVFLISLKAGGFGLNLTAADTVIHLDPWWNPAVEDQATARAHRIGQTRPVTALRLVARGTVEEAVLGLHAAKRDLAAGILEGADVAASLSSDDLMELIRRAPDAGADDA
ncbi:MAG TPA: DEAD/DEAH box helicase [Polyangia bacterium]